MASPSIGIHSQFCFNSFSRFSLSYDSSFINEVNNCLLLHTNFEISNVPKGLMDESQPVFHISPLDDIDI
jgi:hypothetical protein